MAQFHVICETGSTRYPINLDGGSRLPEMFPSYATAKAFATCASGLWGRSSKRFFVAVVGADYSDVGWRTREQCRFDSGEHRRTPWHDEPWYQPKHGDLFCHISKKQPGMVAYTENDAKGAADRQSPIRPGRFLRKFFADVLTNEQIEEWCAKVTGQLQDDALKITQDADEIETVYVNGPDSCMSHDADNYSSPVHPVRVYAGPDTALAYTGPLERAKARCVIWPERKIYTRLYGRTFEDEARLKLLLEEAGYAPGNLNGARIQRISCDYGFVVPYIDRGDNLLDDGKHLIVGEGDISCGETDGVAGDESWMCPGCSERADEHNAQYVQDMGETWCESCCSTDTFYCHHSGNTYSNVATAIEVHYFACTGHVYSDTIHERYADDYGAVYLDGRNEWWKEDDCFLCEDCGTWFHKDDEHVPGLCRDCAEARPGMSPILSSADHAAHVITYQKHRQCEAQEPTPDRLTALAALQPRELSCLAA